MVRNKGYKTYQTGHVTIKLTSFCVTLHCTHYPRQLRLSMFGSQALRFAHYECALCRYFVESNVQYKIKE